MGTKLNYNQLPSTVPQYAKVTLTPTQVKNLLALPVEIVPAPGDGFMLFPVFAQITAHLTGYTPYIISGGGDIILQWGSNDILNGNMAADINTLSQTDNTLGFIYCSPTQLINNFAISQFNNQPLILAQNGTTEITTGDAPVDVVVHYLVIPIS